MNLHKIVAVVREGRFYSRQDLDALLAHVRGRYETAASASPPTPALH